MKYILGLFIVVVMVAGCSGKPESKARTTNSEFDVEKLFEHEGCTAYRFQDYKTIHYVKCDGKPTTTTAESNSCGKNCTRVDTTVTTYEPAEVYTPAAE